MKKFVSIMMVVFVLFTMFASVGQAAAAPPKLFLNGKQLISDVAPRIENDRTLVPLAILSEGIGYDVDWNNDLRMVTVKNDVTTIELIIGQTAVRVNGEIQETEVPPEIIEDRTMVPVRFVGQLLGLEFEWLDKEREVHMTEKTPNTTPDTDPPTGEEESENGNSGSNNGENPVDGEGSAPDNSQTPAVKMGYITSIDYNGDSSSISIKHLGKITPNKPFLLEEPRRLVFDIPNASFNALLANQFEKGQKEIAVEDNPLLSSFRFSQFQLSPLTARLVVLVGEDTGYVMTEKNNETIFTFMPASEVPADSNSGIDPAPPAEPAEGSDPETPANPEEPTGDEPLYDVVIDAGHGAKDPGAFSKTLNKWEKEFNLSMALKIAAALEKDGRVAVHMTRSDDTFVELTDRIKFAEDLKADLFVSIHANSYDNTAVSGSETYYQRPESIPLANVIHKHVLAGTGLKDRGVRQAAYKVIKETTMPAVLIEAGYLTNDGDAKMLYSDSMQNKLADEVAKGILEYLKLN
ncbi:N-acetylmuramoyl-L-alanine amidase [Paenibacillus sp. HB172176]|uniref:N-acetylmuramoyl-L-alanine amidase n=1 Tax=Paenibacillus sp. HB172176 TaxID=2493690 RepID=UPI00143981DB|nr:N-acetylmuramoyl-L-alanine amidase [Paenibacillus sp. HB172176]